MARIGAIVATIVMAHFAAGCAGPDLAAWRARQIAAVAGAPASATPTAEAIRSRRAALDLAGARDLALRWVARQAEDSLALTFASRAESDAVFLFPDDDRENRDLAALSALDYARRAAEAGAEDAAAVAQYGWAMGTSTHLQPMFSRAGHASETLAIVNRALAADPNNATALATLGLLNLRLATLPWIANLMAWGAPDGTIEAATRAAERALARRPSIENRLILAKCLVAAEDIPAARAVLREALAAPDRHPRDRELRAAAERLAKEIEKE